MVVYHGLYIYIYVKNINKSTFDVYQVYYHARLNLYPLCKYNFMSF